MPINQALLGEFDHEMANTRKTLERVPVEKFDWKPHPKSGSLGWLATHIAEIPNWVVPTLEQPSIDIGPQSEYQPPSQAASRAELLERFDSHVKAARAAIANARDEQFIEPWTLLASGKEVFTLPKAAVLRGFVMNHMIHHRAQLGVYLRLNDVPVPALYGPSADERNM